MRLFTTICFTLTGLLSDSSFAAQTISARVGTCTAVLTLKPSSVVGIASSGNLTADFDGFAPDFVDQVKRLLCEHPEVQVVPSELVADSPSSNPDAVELEPKVPERDRNTAVEEVEDSPGEDASDTHDDRYATFVEISSEGLTVSENIAIVLLERLVEEKRELNAQFAQVALTTSASAEDNATQRAESIDRALRPIVAERAALEARVRDQIVRVAQLAAENERLRPRLVIAETRNRAAEEAVLVLDKQVQVLKQQGSTRDADVSRFQAILRSASIAFLVCVLVLLLAFIWLVARRRKGQSSRSIRDEISGEWEWMLATTRVLPPFLFLLALVSSASLLIRALSAEHSLLLFEVGALGTFTAASFGFAFGAFKARLGIQDQLTRLQSP